MRDAFARVLEEEMAQNERIVLITGDLGFGVLRQIHRRFPDRLINAGIAEQGTEDLRLLVGRGLGTCSLFICDFIGEEVAAESIQFSIRIIR